MLLRDEGRPESLTSYHTGFVSEGRKDLERISVSYHAHQLSMFIFRGWGLELEVVGGSVLVTSM